MPVVAPAQTNATWDGGGGNNLWSTGANWVGDVAPAGGTSLFVTFTGSTRTSPFNDRVGWPNNAVAGITFASGASGFRIEGNGIGFVNGSGWQFINQNASATQEINASVSFGPDQNSQINLNAGDLLMSAASSFIDSNASAIRSLVISGDDSTRRTLTITGSLGKFGSFIDPDMVIANNKRVLVTGALTFGSGTKEAVYVNDGVLQFSGAGTMTGGEPVIGNTTGSANAALLLDTAGATFGRQIEIRGGSTGQRIVGGVNTSGTVTYSGNIVASNSPSDYDLKAATGGTVIVSGQRNVPGTLQVNRAEGATTFGGTVEISSTATGGSTATVVNAGTLRLRDVEGSGWGTLRGAVTVNAGAGLDLTGSSAALGWQDGGGVTSLSLGAGSLLNSNTQHVWLRGGTVSLTAATMQTNGGVSSPTGDFFEWGNSPVATVASSGTSVIAGRISLRGDDLPGRILNFTVADGAAATDLLVSAAITEPDQVDRRNVGIAKLGPGTLTLSGSNSYTGGTTVSGGRLVGTTASLQGAITNNAAVTFDMATSGTYAGRMTGSGSLTKTGAGTLTLSNTTVYTGPTAIDGGVIELASLNALQATGTISFGGGTLQYSASNTLDYSDRFSTAPGQQYRIDTNGQNVSFMRSLTSVGGSLVKLGAGNLQLAGTNSYSGGTTVSAGELAGRIYSLQGDILNNAIVRFLGSDAGSYVGAMSGTGALYTQIAGELVLAGTNSYSGGTVISSGSRIRGSTSGVQGAIQNGGVVEFAQATSGTYSGVMSGTGTVTKSGAGVLAFTAANTYTGLTSVNDGGLRLNGSIAGGLNVALIASLSGTGTVGGSATIAGTHSPGNSPGTQTFNGGLTYEAGALVNWELIANTTGTAGVNYDQIIMPSGNLTFSGSTTLALSFNQDGSTVDWSNSFWDVNRAWMIYDLSGGTVSGISNLFVGGSLLDAQGDALSPTGRGFFTTSLVGQEVMLDFVAVPEPATWAMALTGLAAGGLMIRRRRRS
jgi:autotransporter-associated beta strand protein